MFNADLKYFVPVCLYPHTKYRTQSGVTALFEKFELQRHDHLIVVADRLLVLDRLVTGRHWSIPGAFEKARREASQIVSLIRRTSHRFRAQARGRIVYWDEVAETKDFKRFAEVLRGEVLADPVLSSAIERFTIKHVNRFGAGSAPGLEQGYEREYLLSEVCMSIFCTEMMGFWTEVWERPPPPDMPDPLGLIYNGRTKIVQRVAEREVRRVLTFLYEDVHPESVAE